MPVVGVLRDHIRIEALRMSRHVSVEFVLHTRSSREHIASHYVVHSATLWPQSPGALSHYYDAYDEAVTALREYNFDYCDNNFDSLRELARAPARR